jgi:glycosyltransferase involved in cell wall biosynthesis
VNERGRIVELLSVARIIPAECRTHATGQSTLAQPKLFFEQAPEVKLQPVLHLLGSSGVESTAQVRIVEALAEGLEGRGYSVQVWFLGGDGALIQECSQAGLRSRIIEWQNGRRDLSGAFRLRGALRAETFAIVHQHFGGRLVRRVVRTATRARIVAHLGARVSESAHDRLLVPQVRDADAVLATSAAVARIVPGVSAQVVYPGVRVFKKTHTRRRAAHPVVGTVARLVPIKGVLDLVRAFALVRAEVADVRLEIAGSGPERPRLEHEIDVLGLAGAVKLLGWRTDLPQLLPSWDIFALASLDEGLSIAALEAMAAGLPVVATAVGGVPELVSDGKTGFLVPRGDVVALAARLRVLLLDSERRLAMGAAGQARAREEFSIERMVAAVAAVYDDVLRQVPRPGTTAGR